MTTKATPVDTPSQSTGYADDAGQSIQPLKPEAPDLMERGMNLIVIWRDGKGRQEATAKGRKLALIDRALKYPPLVLLVAWHGERYTDVFTVDRDYLVAATERARQKTSPGRT